MHATPARRVALLLFLFVRSTKIIALAEGILEVPLKEKNPKL
tara:strand:- start:361 stop:486 length:126 start_codon:yes stop_codon:yes gene_type:complete